MWNIGQHMVSTVVVVDDEAESRESIGWILSDSDLEMRELEGPLTTVTETQDQVWGANAIICDHHLSSKNYAQFRGAELVSECIKSGLISILCTRFFSSDIDEIRSLLRYIPVVRRPDELNEPDELYEAFALCAEELDGKIPPERKAWRAQIVVERIERPYFDVSVPSWLEESVRLRFADVPSEIEPRIKIGYRTYVEANLGAQTSDQLFVSWNLNA